MGSARGIIDLEGVRKPVGQLYLSTFMILCIPCRGARVQLLEDRVSSLEDNGNVTRSY